MEIADLSLLLSSLIYSAKNLEEGVLYHIISRYDGNAFITDLQKFYAEAFSHEEALDGYFNSLFLENKKAAVAHNYKALITSVHENYMLKQKVPHSLQQTPPILKI